MTNSSPFEKNPRWVDYYTWVANMHIMDRSVLDVIDKSTCTQTCKAGYYNQFIIFFISTIVTFSYEENY